MIPSQPHAQAVKAATFLLLCSAPSAASDSQSRKAIEPDAPAVETPAALEAGPGVTVAGGDVEIVPILERDNSPRLPVPAVVLSSDDGDTLVEGPSGNPYFLGFAAGSYFPPEGERIDPKLIQLTSVQRADGRPTQETYAYVMLEGRITDEVVERLESVGARVLGDHPSNCLKVAVDGDAALAISELSEVRWIGVPQNWQKVHPVLTRELAGELQDPNAEDVDLFVSVYDSDLNEDSEYEEFGRTMLLDPSGPRDAPEGNLPSRVRSRGWQELSLRNTGAQDPIYIDQIRAFRLRIHPGQIEALKSLDYVAFVELALKSKTTHEESMPLTNADRGRVSYDGGSGTVARIGVVDWGLDAGHSGLNHAYGWGWSIGPGTGGPWNDPCGHGTHVAGTVFGNDNVEDSYQGAAPGIGPAPWQRFYKVRVGGDTCGAVFIDDAAVLSLLEGSVNDGSNTTSPPHVINHSYGNSTGGPFYGTEAGARLYDNSGYLRRQLHVFAAGNDGSGGQTLTLQASAKNALTVGNVLSHESAGVGLPGTIWTSSSRGPTADLRWGPKISAPGVNIRSVNSHTGTGYTLKTGTSMAAPHVTGIAAQLIDRHSFLHYRPTVVKSVMMAGSITKNGQALSGPSTSSTHHYNTYGTGRIDAYKASTGNSQQAMYFWGYDQDASGYGQFDFPVGAGATKVTIVMNYNERAGSAGASSPLLNNLDMWVDRAPFTAGGNTGEYFGQQSTRDTTEMRIINNPTVTDYRIKIYPTSSAAGGLASTEVGVCAIVTYADTTPALTYNVTTPDQYVQTGDAVDINVSAYSPSYIASGVFLSTSGLGTVDGATGVLEDGSTVNYKTNSHSGLKALLGNIRHGKTRTAHWDTHWNTDGIKTVTITAESDNAGTDVDSVNIYVDGVPPSGPTSFISTSHSPGFSCDSSLQVSWNTALDSISGVEGYRLTVDHSSQTDPTGTLNYGSSQTSATVNLATSTQPWYAHLRARDRSGNWGTTKHIGPFEIHTEGPYTYCYGEVNSTGSGAQIGWGGSTSIAANNLALQASPLPSGVPCIFFYAPNEIVIPFGNGFRCVGGSIYRLPVVVATGGWAGMTLDYANLPDNGDINVGDTWKFQNWYRDMPAGGAGFNLSNALSVTFCP